MEYVTGYSVQSLAETFLKPKNFQLDIATQLRVFLYRWPVSYVRSKQIRTSTMSRKFPKG